MTKVPRSLLQLAVILGSLCLMGCVFVTPATATRTQTFTVPSGYTLVVQTFNGSVQIVGATGRDVNMTATIHQPDDVQFDAVLAGNTLRITAKPKRTNISPSPGASLTIEAPPDADLQLETSNGAIDVTGVGTGGEAVTSNGRITFKDVSGDYRLDSSNGRIEMSGVSGSFDASTSNGSITFAGQLSPDAGTSLRTSNGGISVVVGKDSNVRLDAQTSNGQVHVAYPLNDATIDKDRVVGTLGTGASSLILRTSNGDIDVR